MNLQEIGSYIKQKSPGVYDEYDDADVATVVLKHYPEYSDLLDDQPIVQDPSIREDPVAEPAQRGTMIYSPQGRFIKPPALKDTSSILSPQAQPKDYQAGMPLAAQGTVPPQLAEAPAAQQPKTEPVMSPRPENVPETLQLPSQQPKEQPPTSQVPTLENKYTVVPPPAVQGPTPVPPQGEIQRNRTKLEPQDEQFFQQWFKDVAGITGISPNPDDPEHKYDYRGAFKAGHSPILDEENPDFGHWPSQFKDDDHPNRFVNGVDTKYGQGVPQPKEQWQADIEAGMKAAAASIDTEGAFGLGRKAAAATGPILSAAPGVIKEGVPLMPEAAILGAKRLPYRTGQMAADAVSALEDKEFQQPEPQMEPNAAMGAVFAGIRSPYVAKAAKLLSEADQELLQGKYKIPEHIEKNLLARGTAQGVEMLGPTMLTVATSIVTGSPLAAVPTTMALFGLSTYKNTKDELINAGIPEKEADTKALIHGISEGGIETIGNVVELATMGLGKPAKEAAKELAKRGVKGLVKRLGSVFGEEYAEEVAQGSTEKYLKDKYKDNPKVQKLSWSDVLVEPVIPVLISTLGLGGMAELARRGAIKGEEPSPIKPEIVPETPSVARPEVTTENLATSGRLPGEVSPEAVQEATVREITPNAEPIPTAKEAQVRTAIGVFQQLTDDLESQKATPEQITDSLLKVAPEIQKANELDDDELQVILKHFIPGGLEGAGQIYRNEGSVLPGDEEKQVDLRPDEEGKDQGGKDIRRDIQEPVGGSKGVAEGPEEIRQQGRQIATQLNEQFPGHDIRFDGIQVGTNGNPTLQFTTKKQVGGMKAGVTFNAAEPTLDSASEKLKEMREKWGAEKTTEQGIIKDTNKLDTNKWNIPEFGDEQISSKLDFLGKHRLKNKGDAQKIIFLEDRIKSYEPPKMGKFLLQENIDEISKAIMAMKEGKILSSKELNNIILKNLPLPEIELKPSLEPEENIEDNVNHYLSEYMRGEIEPDSITGAPPGSRPFKDSPELYNILISKFQEDPTKILRLALNDIKRINSQINIYDKFLASDEYKYIEEQLKKEYEKKELKSRVKIVNQPTPDAEGAKIPEKALITDVSRGTYQPITEGLKPEEIKGKQPAGQPVIPEGTPGIEPKAKTGETLQPATPEMGAGKRKGRRPAAKGVVRPAKETGINAATTGEQVPERNAEGAEGDVAAGGTTAGTGGVTTLAMGETEGKGGEPKKNVRFSVSPQKPPSPPSTQQITSTVTPLSAKTGINLDVSEKVSKDYPANARAAYHPDTDSIELIAENIESPEEAARIFIEESVGHRGLRKTMGKDVDSFLMNLWLAKNKDIKASGIPERYEHDLGTKEGKLGAAEEWFAHEAVNNPEFKKTTWWTRFVAMVRDWLRKIGLKLKLSDNDIASVLNRAAEIKAEQKAVSEVPAVRGYEPTAPVTTYDVKAKAVLFEGQPLFSLKDKASELDASADKLRAENSPIVRDSKDTEKQKLINEDIEYERSYFDNIKDTINAVKNSGKDWKITKEDSKLWERVMSVPAYYFDKYPPAKKVYRAAIDRIGDLYHMTHAMTHSPDGISYMDEMTKFDKADKKESKKLNQYLFDTDRAGKSYTVAKNEESGKWVTVKGSETIGEYQTEKQGWEAAIDHEAGRLSELGFSDNAVRAFKSARTITNNGFDILYADMRATIKECEDAGVPLPEVVIREDGKPVGIDLREALKRMGNLRGSYMPRIRRQGNWKVYAHKEGEPLEMQVFPNKFEATKWADGMKRKGYTASKEKNEVLPKDIFESANKIVDIQQIINAALDKVDKSETKKTLFDFGFETENYKDEKGENFLIVRGPYNKQQSEIFKKLGGKFYADKDEIKGWHFTTGKTGATKKLENKIVKSLLTSEDIFLDTTKLFAKSMTENIANLLREHGIRQHMIKRGETPVLGYEENYIPVLAQYAQSIASSESKKKMALKMVRAITGTDVSWQEYQDINPEAEYKDWLDIVKEKRVDAGKQPNLYKDLTTYMHNMLRSDSTADRITGVIKAAAVLKYLGFRVSSVAVNLTNLAMAVPATMSQDVNIPIHKTYKYITNGIVDWTKYKAGGELPEDLMKAAKHISEHGWDEKQFNKEALSILRSKIGGGYEDIVQASMWMFGASEQLNRGATILGSYQALRDQGKGHDEALSTAREVSDYSHGTYGKENYPHYAQGSNLGADLIRSFYVFKTFSHNYLLNMARMGAQSFKDKNSKGAKNALYMMFAPALLGGIGAVVGATVLKAILQLIGWNDPAEDTYKWLRGMSQYAENAARSGVTGILNHGISFKNSLEIDFLGNFPTTITELVGAPGEVVGDIVKGFAQIGKGNVWKGSELLMPNVMASASKGYREHKEGVTTWNNAPVWFGTERLKPDFIDTIIRMIGFTPTNITKKKDIIYSEKQLASRYAEKRIGIYGRLNKYCQLPPSEMSKDRYWNDVLKYVEEYNNEVNEGKLFPAVPLITGKSIRQEIMGGFRPNKSEMMRTTGENKNTTVPINKNTAPLKYKEMWEDIESDKGKTINLNPGTPIGQQ